MPEINAKQVPYVYVNCDTVGVSFVRSFVHYRSDTHIITLMSNKRNTWRKFGLWRHCNHHYKDMVNAYAPTVLLDKMTSGVMLSSWSAALSTNVLDTETLLHSDLCCINQSGFSHGHSMLLFIELYSAWMQISNVQHFAFEAIICFIDKKLNLSSSNETGFLGSSFFGIFIIETFVHMLNLRIITKIFHNKMTNE